MHCHLKFLVAAVFGICFAIAPSASGLVLYVDQDAVGANNGLSWQDAFIDLQDALAVATNSPLVDEIWVARGNYKPDPGTYDQSLSFHLVSGVGLYGGFAGHETDCAQRDWIANETILSGDLYDDDDLGVPSGSNCCEAHEGLGCDVDWCAQLVCNFAGYESCCVQFTPSSEWNLACAIQARLFCGSLCGPQWVENSFHVVQAEGVNSDTIIDGFTIRGGSTLGHFELFATNRFGGGLRCVSGSPTIRHCRFKGNGAERGGGVELDLACPATIIDCSFVDNRGSRGGGLHIDSAPFIADCTFENNIGANGGGAAASGGGGSPRFERCRFSGNVAHSSGGVSDFSQGATFDQCLFKDNYANGQGATFAEGSTFTRCAFIGNRARYAFGAAYPASSVAKFYGCIFVNNQSRVAGANGESGNVTLYANCLFIGNRATGDEIVMGHAGAVYSSSTTYLYNTLFLDNHASDSAGALDYFGGEGSHLQVKNSIFWNNSDATGATEQAQITVNGFPGEFTTSINHNIFEGWTGGLGGEGNFDVDPLFTDELGPDGMPYTGDENLNLLPTSPAINAGNPPPPGSDLLPDTELNGHPRVLCGTVDLGPYEFGIGDFDCNQVVNLFDFASWMPCMNGPSLSDNPPPLPSGCEAFDFNADSNIDLSDFAGWQNTYAGG